MNGEALLRLFFHGLVALVHDRPAPEMSAYLVDDHHHVPLVTFEMPQGSTCPSTTFGHTRCIEDTQEPRWCICYLGNPVDISFDPPSHKGKPSIGSRPRREVPGNVSEADDFEWLVRMNNIDRRAAKAKEVLDSEVRARMSFGWEDAQSCHLDQSEEENCSNCRFRIHPFKFVSDFSQPSGTFVHEQALAESTKFDLRFDSSTVKLVISERHGANKITLDLGCSNGRCPDVLVANLALPPTAEQRAFPDLGLHFRHYYQLSAEHEEVRIPVRLKRDTFRVPDMPRTGAVDCVEVGNGQLYTCDCDPLRRRVALLATRGVTYEANGFEDELSYTADISKLLKAFNKIAITSVNTRIICPMVMLEP